MPIAMRNAYTVEIDDLDSALEELTGQLDLENLKSNSVGLLFAHNDFIEEGIVKALSERLPFDVVGMTTLANATNGEFDCYQLSLSVLTSDDVSFKAILTEPLEPESYKEVLAKTYGQACDTFSENPSFIIPILPFDGDISGADIVLALDTISEGTSCWGGLAYSGSGSPGESRTLFNGSDYSDRAAFIFLCGAVEPRFVLKNIPEQNIREYRAVITGAEGCIVKTVNNMPFADYMLSIGVKVYEDYAGAITILVYYGAGAEPVSLGIYKVFEDGSALMGAEMLEGATIALGNIDPEGILATADAAFDEILALDDVDALLMLPCMTRYLMLSPSQDLEMQNGISRLGDAFPYVLGYSGGEICPVKSADGVLSNRFHNYTFSACIL